MSHCTDPADMFADERLEEIASILARGVACVLGRVSGDHSVRCRSSRWWVVHCPRIRLTEACYWIPTQPLIEMRRRGARFFKSMLTAATGAGEQIQST